MKIIIFLVFMLNCTKDINLSYKLKGSEELIIAVKLNDLNRVKELVKKESKESINKAFILALLEKYTNIAKFLLNRGADINSKDEDGKTALLIAIWDRNFDMAKILINRGADVNIVDNKGDTPLTYASRGGNLNIIKLLIDKGADINKKTEQGLTPLTLSLYNGHSEVADFLISSGAKYDINYEDFYGGNILMYAAKCGKINLVKEIVEKGMGVNCRDKKNENVIFYAVSSKFENLEVVEYLLRKGANPNSFNCNDSDDDNIDKIFGETALMVAVRLGYINIVKLLIRYGVDINAQKYCGTALMAASFCNKEEIVKLLSELGADVNIKSKSGYTTLMCAADRGHVNILSMLIKAGAKVKKKGKLSLTALGCAVSNGHLEAVKLLVENGADVNDKYTPGLSLLEISSGKIKEFLIKKGAKRNNEDTMLKESSSCNIQ